MSVISKIFESVLIELFDDFLKTGNLQFGFKKKTAVVPMHFLHSQNPLNILRTTVLRFMAFF